VSALENDMVMGNMVILR